MAVPNSLSADEIEALRENNIPDILSTLLIAESPPNRGFFYLASNSKVKGLFYETMMVLYGSEFCDAWNHTPQSHMSQMRTDFIRRFKDDGYYLVDASRTILSGWDYEDKVEYLSMDSSKAWFATKIESIIPRDARGRVRVVLITKSVYEVHFDALRQNYNILNNRQIPFPRYNWQKKIFRQELSRLLGIPRSILPVLGRSLECDSGAPKQV